MADTKISALTELNATPASNDEFAIVDTDASATKRISYTNLLGNAYTIGGTDVPVTDGGTGASTASGARTNLGLAIGTDVQAYDAGLASIAGLTTAADKMIYTTASDTYAVTDLSSFARTILDDADASAVRTTIGAVGTADSQTLTNKTIDGDNNTISNLDIGNEVDWAAAADVTDASAFASGDKLLIFEAGVGMRKVDYDDLPGSGGGIANVVEDTTPQLGGQLDVNGNAIGDGTLELLTFTETASAVNQINITNATTTNAPTLGVAGDDINIDLALAGKGSGNVTVGGNRVLTTGDEGTGNGLDADTVDGIEASAFLQNVVEDTTPQLGGELDAQGNSITDLGDVTFKTGATGGTLRTGTSAADKFTLQAYDVDGAAYQTVIELDAGNTPVLQLRADFLEIDDETDNTKRVTWDVSGATTSTATDLAFSQTANRTITFPDATGTIALTSDLHSAVTLAGTPDYLTLSGQEITLGQIDLTTDVTGDLPFANIAQIATNRLLGRNTAGTGDIEALTGTTARGILGLATSDSPQFAAVNIGAATDTTVARVSAGDISVEGNLIYRAGGTDVPVTDGGTGASTAAGARTNLGIYSTKAITVESPTSSEDITMFFTDDAITITQMNAVLANGSSTPSVTWTIRHSTDRSAAGNEVVTGGTTTTSITSGSEVTSFNDATVPAGSWVWLETTAQSGTVPELSVTLEYTHD